MKNISIKHLVLGLSLIFIVVAIVFYLQEAKPSKEALITKATPVSYVGALPINAEDISTQATPSLTDMATAITAEALKAFSDSADYSLPLFSHWDVGKTEVMNPTYMLSRLEAGEHVLVSWKLNLSNLDTTVYEESIKKAAELELPLIFIVPAPESSLIEEGYSLSESENPNVIDADGNILDKLSPFGPDKNWYDIGKKWSSSSLMAQIQEWYPNPPLVVFMNENIASKLSWSELETSSRYTSNYPSGKDDEYKRALVGAKWIEKYRQMHAGFKLGFVKEDWKNNVKFVSYNDFSDDLGQLSTWAMNSTLTKQYLDICPFTVNGTTVNFDLTQSINYTNIDAPQISINNLPFMLKEAKRNNPSFVQQLSIAHNSNITDSSLYRGLTQFGLWFLRPSIIRQNSPVGTLEETEQLFNEMSNSVELIYNSDILSDFWKNGKLVSNGESDLNSNIPEQYQDDPRWFLLDVDANPSRPWSDSSNIKVWSFALVKGTAPNREWLIFTQSPETEMSNVTVTIPEHEDVLIDSDKNGKFFILLENDNQLNPMTFQTISEESTTLPNVISPYSETVNLPTCDANNPEVQFIESDSDWNHINDTDKSIFCVSPGDYVNAGTVQLTTSGTENDKRYIVLNNGNDLHPAKLNQNEIARVRLSFKDTNYWVIDRMSYWESLNTDNPVKLINSDNNLISRHFLKNVGNGIYLYPGSDNNTIQQCRIDRDNINIHYDRAAIGLYDNQQSNISITNTKILNNEIKNFVDGFQAIRMSTLNLNYEGTILDNNTIYIDNTIYTDCNGNHDPEGQCAYAENAIDLKAGSNNPNNPIVISNNKMWGYKKSDTTNSELNDHGTAIAGHYNVKNLLIENNLIMDSDFGININSPLDGLSSINNANINNNIFQNILNYPIGLVSASDISITNNLFTDLKKYPNLQYGIYWLLVINSKNIQVENNRVFNTNGRSALLLTLENLISNQNEYFDSEIDSVYSNTTLESLSDVLHSTDPTTSYINYELSIDQFTDTPTQVIKENIISTE